MRCSRSGFSIRSCGSLSGFFVGHDDQVSELVDFGNLSINSKSRSVVFGLRAEEEDHDCADTGEDGEDPIVPLPF